MSSLAHHFAEGGFFMPWLVFIFALVAIACIERMAAIVRARWAGECGTGTLELLRNSRDVEGTLGWLRSVRGAMPRIVEAGLREAGLPMAHIGAAMDYARAIEVARLQRRSGVLALLAKVAFLVGLLGTVVGMGYIAYGCPPPDATSRATMLAKATSEALNNNALGLLIAIVAWVSHHLIAAAVMRNVQHLNAESARFQLELAPLHPFLRLAGRPPPNTLTSYRGPLPATR